MQQVSFWHSRVPYVSKDHRKNSWILVLLNDMGKRKHAGKSGIDGAFKGKFVCRKWQEVHNRVGIN